MVEDEYGFDVYSSFDSPTVARTGIMPYPNTKKEKLLGGHAVLIVGCDKDRKLFEIKNSWGTDGGNQGYAAMDFSFFSGDNGRLYEGYKK